MTGIKMKTPELRGRHGSRPSTAEANEESPSLVNADEEHLSFHHPKAAFKQPPFPRDQYGSPCHGTMGRADVWPFDNCSSAPLSPYIYTERGHVPDHVKIRNIHLCANTVIVKISKDNTKPFPQYNNTLFNAI